MIKNIKIDLTNLENRYYRKSDKIESELSHEFKKIKWFIISAGLLMLIGGFFIAYFTTRSIVQPVHSLRKVLLGLGKGRFPKELIKVTEDEIGEMSAAMNHLVKGMKHTKDFSREVASGNFEYEYHPLSDQDDLGRALILMRDELKERERILEKKVEERTREIENQKDKISELYKDVTDSIKYAKRLQNSILPPDSQVKQALEKSFVLYLPKDIVSGDFYWMNVINKNELLFGAIDCTGHGVPGAFMSLVAYNGLNQAVQEHNKVHPHEVLKDLNQIAGESLNKDHSVDFVRDGMDLAVCKLNKKTLDLEYSGAKNPIYIIRDKELMIYHADKISIGEDNLNHEFTLNKIKLRKGDMIYLFTDGYVDQFGGEHGKKFKFANFRDLLLSISDKDVEEQHEILYDTIVKWQGNYEQLDDIMIFGVRV
jgi:serine phosphatase RsbU (regulator of sigma subunit)